MKGMTQMALMVLLAGSAIQAGSNAMKHYEIKSAKILYEIRGGGDVMGMVQTKVKGKKRLIFDQYGAKEIAEIVKVTQTTANGKSKVKKLHTLRYTNGTILYKADFEKKKIMRMQNTGMAVVSMFGGGKNMAAKGKAMMQKMGGKMIGHDKVLGYDCEVWDLMGVQQCIHRGVTLRIVSDIMGMKNSEVATKIAFDLPLDKEAFALPNFPLVNADGNPLNLDRSRLDAMDAEQNTKTAQETAEAGKAMAAGLKALAASGANLSSGRDLTPTQQQAVQKAMMATMGGEKSLFAREKQEILGELKKMPQAKACFRRANTVAEVNACEREFDSEDPEHHTHWSTKEKATLLKEMEVFEKAMPCIKTAQDFQALQQCMPQ